MRRMRFWLPLVTVSAVALAAGCSSASAGAGSGGGSGEVTLTLLSSSTVKSAITTLAQKFEQENPTIKISISSVPDAALPTTLPQELAAGNAADIFTSWPGIYSTQAAGVLGNEGYALNLSNQPWAKTLPTRLKSLVGADGKTYFAPLVSLPILAIYNQTALTKAGLSIPTTWDSVLSFCKAATKKGVIPFALGAETAFSEPDAGHGAGPERGGPGESRLHCQQVR